MTEPNTDTNNQVPLEIELLTCSASDYAKSDGRELSAYTFIEITTDDTSKLEKDHYWSTPLLYFKNQAKEKGCIVVVDLRPCYDDHFERMRYCGTGLKIKNVKP